jgi:hypothetical protein
MSLAHPIERPLAPPEQSPPSISWWPGGSSLSGRSRRGGGRRPVFTTRSVTQSDDRVCRALLNCHRNFKPLVFRQFQPSARCGTRTVQTLFERFQGGSRLRFPFQAKRQESNSRKMSPRNKTYLYHNCITESPLLIFVIRWSLLPNAGIERAGGVAGASR